MRRLITTFAVAGATMLTLHAQSTETKTKIKTEHGQTVTYTGCVGNGTETRSYILQNVTPISRTETTTASGTSVSTANEDERQGRKDNDRGRSRRRAAAQGALGQTDRRKLLALAAVQGSRVHG
jgi:hypothetical protein